MVKITDTGIGITKENQVHLFTPFNQLDTSITRRFGGTGLGLVICKKIISQLGGTIEINSEIDKGTEITFSISNILPQKNSKKPELIKLPQQVHHDHFTLTGKLILIAEDNNFVKNLLVKIFENEGAEVVSKDDGEQALKVLEYEKPDLVILDYQMPVLDGIETCKKIREKYSLQELPVVLLTADIINTNKKETKKSGINKVIYKPIQGDELVDCVEKLIFGKNKNTKKENEDNKTKVLDLISDDVLQLELKNLQGNIVKKFETKDFQNLHRHIHDLCGIAGPTTQYKKLWEIGKTLDLKVKDQKYDDMEKDIRSLKNITI